MSFQPKRYFALLFLTIAHITSSYANVSSDSMTAMIKKNFDRDGRDSDKNAQAIKTHWIRTAAENPIEPVFAWFGQDIPASLGQRSHDAIFEMTERGKAHKGTHQAAIITDKIRSSFYDGEKILVPIGENIPRYWQFSGRPEGTNQDKLFTGVIYREKKTGDVYYNRVPESAAVYLPFPKEMTIQSKSPAIYPHCYTLSDPLRGLVSFDISNTTTIKTFIFDLMHYAEGPLYSKFKNHAYGPIGGMSADISFHPGRYKKAAEGTGSIFLWNETDLTEDENEEIIPRSVPFPTGAKKLWFAWDYSNILKDKMPHPEKRTSEYDEPLRFGVSTPDLSHDKHEDNTKYVWYHSPERHAPMPQSTFWSNIGVANGGNSNIQKLSNFTITTPAPDRFCTPPFCYGRFLFWRNAWKAPRKDQFSVRFNAYGDTARIALSNVRESMRGLSGGPEGTFDGLTAHYVIAIDAGKTRIFRACTGQTFKGQKESHRMGCSPTSSEIDQIVWENEVASSKSGITSTSKYHPYWVSCDRGHIMVGRGEVPGEDVILDYTDDAPLSTEYCSFTNIKYPVDYIDIKVESYSDSFTADSSNDSDVITHKTWKLPEDNSGSITFMAKNLSKDGGRDISIGFFNKEATRRDDALAHIAWGAYDNSQSYILANGQVISRDTGAQSKLPQSTEWVKLWALVSHGNIMYGRGENIGENIIASGRIETASPLKHIGFFGKGSAIAVKDVSISRAERQDSHHIKTPRAGVFETWQPTWRLLETNKGVARFTVSDLSTSSQQYVMIGLGSERDAQARLALYDIVIGHENKVKIRKGRVTKKEAYLPSSARLPEKGVSRTYWASFDNGTISVGFGSQPGEPSRTLASWKDESTNKQITRFSFSSGNHQARFSNIASLNYSKIEEAITLATKNKAAQESILKQWAAQPSERTIPQEFARRYYWHDDHTFSKPGSGSFSFSLERKDTQNTSVMIGLSNEKENTLATDYNGARYSVVIEHTGTIYLADHATGKNSGMATHDQAKRLSKPGTHAVWMNYNDDTVSIGIDTQAGKDAAWSHKLSDPKPLQYVSLTTTQNPVTFKDISVGEFGDPRFFETKQQRGIIYSWRNEWKLDKPDFGTVSFKLKKSVGSPYFFIGLGGTKKPNASRKNYDGALYNIVLHHAGHIFARRSDSMTKNINPLISQKAKGLGDGKEHDLWFIYGDNTIMLGIDTTPGIDPVWVWHDENPHAVETEKPADDTLALPSTPDSVAARVHYFSFATYDSSVELRDITSAPGISTRTLESDLKKARTLFLRNDKEKAFATLEKAFADQLHTQDIDAFASTLETLSQFPELLYGSPVLIAQHPDIQSQPHAKRMTAIIKSLTIDPSLTPTAKAKLTTAQAALEKTISVSSIVAALSAQAGTISDRTPSDFARRLFFISLNVLSHAPTEMILVESTAITALLNSIKVDTIDRNERSIVDGFKEKLGASSSDVSGKLKNISAYITRNRAGSLTLSDGQKKTLFTWMQGLVSDRDSLSDAQQEELKRLITTARYAPMYRGTEYIEKLNTEQTRLATVRDFSTVLASLLPRAADVVYFDEKNPQRVSFFSMLGRLEKAPGERSSADMTKLNEALLQPLMSAPHSTAEKTVLNRLKKMVDEHATQQKTARYQLAQIEKQSVDLYGYAKELDRVLRGYGTAVTFSDSDHEIFVTQLNYVVHNRELLDATQITFVRSMVAFALTQSGFAGMKASLQNIDKHLQTPHLFSARVAYAQQELASLIKRKTTSPHPRITRFITKLERIIGAPGVKKEADFATLQSHVIKQLLTLPLSDGEKKQVVALNALITKEKERILIEQKKFSYHFALAQEEKGNTSAYVSALNSIIRNEYSKALAFSQGDDEKFLYALDELTNRRYELSATEMLKLKNTLTIAAKYSTVYKGKPLGEQMSALLVKVDTAVPLTVRIEKLADQLQKILPLKADDASRVRFFANAKQLMDAKNQYSQADVTSLKTVLVEPLTESRALLNAQEQKEAEALKTFVTNKEKNLNSISTLSERLDTQVTEAHQHPSVSALRVEVAGLFALFSRIAQKTTPVNRGDEKIIVNRIENLVRNRATLSETQRAQVSSLINKALAVAELRPEKARLEKLAAEMKQDVVFEQLLNRYITEVGEVSSLPATDGRKARFITNVAGLMNAPGTRTAQEIETIETKLLALISPDYFTAEQRTMLKPLTEWVAREKKRVASAAYRIDAADNASTPAAYHEALKIIISDAKANKVTFEAQDVEVFMTAIKEEVELRPLAVRTGSTLSILLVDAQSLPAFSSQVSELKELVKTEQTAANPFERARYFAQNASIILSEPENDGDRLRFFARVNPFIMETTSLSQEEIIAKNEALSGKNGASLLKGAMNGLEGSLASSRITAHEKTKVKLLIKRMRDMADELEKTLKNKAAQAQRTQAAQRAMTTTQPVRRATSRSISKNRFYRGRGRGRGRMVYTPR